MADIGLGVPVRGLLAEAFAGAADGALGVVVGIGLVRALLGQLLDQVGGLCPLAQLLADLGPSPVRSATQASVLEAVGPARVASDSLAGRKMVEGRPVNRAALVIGPADDGIVPVVLFVPEAWKAHAAGDVGDGRIAAVVLGKAGHGVLGLVWRPARARVPENLVAVLGTPDHDGGEWDRPALASASTRRRESGPASSRSSCKRRTSATSAFSLRIVPLRIGFIATKMS